MQAIQNSRLEKVAEQVRERLKRVVDAL